jgi:hypothetical protein
MVPKGNGAFCPRLEPNVNGAGLGIDFFMAGSDGFCSGREENPVPKPGAGTLPKLTEIVLVVTVEVLGVPKAGFVSLAPKLKLGAVVAEAKLDNEGDTVAVMVTGPNAVMVAVLVTGTKLGVSIFDVVAPKVSLLFTWEPKLNIAGATVFCIVPNACVDPEVLADC